MALVRVANEPLAVPAAIRHVLKFNSPLGEAVAQYYVNVFGAIEINRVTQMELHGLERYSLMTVQMQIGGVTYLIQETGPNEILNYPDNLHVSLNLHTDNMIGLVQRIAVHGGFIIRWQKLLNQQLLKLQDPFGYVWFIASP